MNVTDERFAKTQRHRNGGTILHYQQHIGVVPVLCRRRHVLLCIVVAPASPSACESLRKVDTNSP
jgi:hypothetical protein